MAYLSATAAVLVLLASPATALNALGSPADHDLEIPSLPLPPRPPPVFDLPIECVALLGTGNGIEMTCLVCQGFGGFGDSPIHVPQQELEGGKAYVYASGTYRMGVWGPYTVVGVGTGDMDC